MKTIFEGNKNDFIITEYITPKRGENGKFIPSNQGANDGYVKHRGYVHNIEAYCQIDNSSGQPNQFVKVIFTSSEIKQLYKIIVDIENKEIDDIPDEF